jgi:hypothetical protein
LSSACPKESFLRFLHADWSPSNSWRRGQLLTIACLRHSVPRESKSRHDWEEVQMYSAPRLSRWRSDIPFYWSILRYCEYCVRIFLCRFAKSKYFDTLKIRLLSRVRRIYNRSVSHFGALIPLLRKYKFKHFSFCPLRTGLENNFDWKLQDCYKANHFNNYSVKHPSEI